MHDFSVQKKQVFSFRQNFSDALYHIFLLNGKGTLTVDCTSYSFDGRTAIFTSPYQNIAVHAKENVEVRQLDFHGDFYCIEYHKKEVACNGLLFNTIYLFPHINLPKKTYDEVEGIFEKMAAVNQEEDFSEAVLKSYLQLILALCSKVKIGLLKDRDLPVEEVSLLKQFQSLLEEHFLSERSPAFYAAQLHISPNTLSKKLKTEFGKSPSKLIQERVILEAKKQIHLTHRSIKEIAALLHFEDVFYFSRYFKKYTGVSPTQFRDEVGISIVAKKPD